MKNIVSITFILLFATMAFGQRPDNFPVDTSPHHNDAFYTQEQSDNGTPTARKIKLDDLQKFYAVDDIEITETGLILKYLNADGSYTEENCSASEVLTDWRIAGLDRFNEFTIAQRISTTGQASLFIDSDNDGSGESFSVVVFENDRVDMWTMGKNNIGEFYLSDQSGTVRWLVGQNSSGKYTMQSDNYGGVVNYEHLFNGNPVFVQRNSTEGTHLRDTTNGLTIVGNSGASNSPNLVLYDADGGVAAGDTVGVIGFWSTDGSLLYETQMIAGFFSRYTTASGAADIHCQVLETTATDSLVDAFIVRYATRDVDFFGDVSTVNGGSFIDDGTTLSVPDYVFEDDYDLPSIEDHAEFMAKEKHLPKVTPARDINGSPGYNMAERREQILEELETAHLYIVQLSDKIKELEKRIDAK